MLIKADSPQISVLLPAYNAESFISQSVRSVLAQTYDNFELLVVNDASTDRTGEILSSINDHRLRILHNPRNLGIVGSLNRAMSEACGKYIARIDADDICLPTRFAKQKEFLDCHPQTMVVGSEMFVLERGQITVSHELTDADPRIVRWMLHVSNPIGHPSMMFRANVVTVLQRYLREEFQYVEDFDFSHRAVCLGDICVMPEHLVIYRKHDTNLTRMRRAEMISRCAVVLSHVYAELLRFNCDVESKLVAEHLMAGSPLDGGATLERLGLFLNRLVTCFIARYALNDEQAQKVKQSTGKLWWRMILLSMRSRPASISALPHDSFQWSEETRPPSYRIARSMVVGLLPEQLKTRLRQSEKRRATTRRHVDICGVEFCEDSTREDDPPILYIIVDTEEKLDWEKGFDRRMTRVDSIRDQMRAQTIFDRYGARPIYVIDYPVASQPEGYEPLAEIFNRGGCAIGAHLHPWVTPPYEEVVSNYNSFAGNLPADLEERKLRNLTAMIERSFGISPMFFKAGRYGLGPNTINILIRLGYQVDFSILPLSDLRAGDGPDFRFAGARPYRVEGGKILSIPMSRAQIGPLSPMSPRLHSVLHSPAAIGLHLPGILARLSLANTVTLTPEGVTADEQIHLIDSMRARGHRIFALHYHSTSLGKETPYVTTDLELNRFIDRIEKVCHYFFNIGGLPGNPADLVPPSMRDRVWVSRSLNSKARLLQKRSASRLPVVSS